MIVASFVFRVSLSPDRFIVLLLLAGLATGRARQFLKDWSIFLIVLLAWQVLNGFSRQFGHLKPHVTEMIFVDRHIFFGHVPTIWLQQHFYHPGHLAWYDVAATSLYLLHFVFPMVVAFVLWNWKRPIFMEFMLAFLILALAGFATFVLFPAAPPWLASMWHYLPHVHRIFSHGLNYFGGAQSFSALYTWIYVHAGGWDLVGAMPSEHAAFPFLCFLYARRAWPVRGWIIIPYCLAVWVAVVYLGEHYAADVIVGILYAALAFAVVQFALSRWGSKNEALSQAPALAVSDSVLV